MRKMGRGFYTEEIASKLNMLSEEIKLFNSLNRFDINRTAEDFYARLLNLVFDYKLENANRFNKNAPAIDLFDLENKIAIQITSDGSSRKIQHTIDMFIKNQLNQSYNRLIVFVIAGRRKQVKQFDTKEIFAFDPKNDIWDISYLMEYIKGLDIKLMKRINDFLSEELGIGAADQGAKLGVYDFRKYHDTQKNCNGAYGLLEINTMLFPAMSAWNGKRYANNRGNTIPLISCISTCWKCKKWSHLLLLGEGGMGKTTALLQLWDRLLERGICSLYVSLHELNWGDEEAIRSFIIRKVSIGEPQKTNNFIKSTINRTDFPKFVLLLDGFNEVPEEYKRRCIHAIMDWMCYGGVQIIMTSRYDLRTDMPVENLKELRIEPLSKQQIKKWFTLCQMPLPDENEKMWELLKTPLMLTLYTQVESQYNRGKNAAFIKWKEPSDTAGSLIWNYIQCQILKISNNAAVRNVDILTAIVASTCILPYICWKMEKAELFTFSSEQLSQWTNEAVLFYKSRHELRLNAWIRQLEFDFGEFDWNSRGLIRTLNNMHIVVKQNVEEYALVHQNFRDFLAAVHLNQVVEVDYNAQASAEAWEQTPFSNRVVTFLAEWISEATVNRLLEAARSKQIPERNYSLFNLIRIIRKMKNDDLSDMDFSNMDLRTVQLNGARLTNGTHHTRFCHSQISHGTLIMQGHHDKLYYVAFSADGKQLVSISACEIRIWDINTSRCVHEITEGVILPDGCAAYDSPQFHKKFVTADGKEIVWIGETETCRKGFVDLFSDLFQPDERWKDEPYSYTRVGGLEAIVQYRTTEDKATIQKNGVMVFLPTGEKRMLSGNKAMATCVNLSKDSNYCVAGLEDGSICIWDLKSGKLTGGFPRSSHHISCVSGDHVICIGQTSGTAMIWEQPYRCCSHVLEGRGSPVTQISFSKKAHLCVVCHEDDVAEIWDLSKNSKETILGQQYMSISRDGKLFCGKTTDGTVWYQENQEKNEKKIIWTGVERTQQVRFWGSWIFKWSDVNDIEQFSTKERKYYMYPIGYFGYRDMARIECQHSLVILHRLYLQIPEYIYTIINLNVYGCDFTDAIFETLELAAKVKSNGGILELPVSCPNTGLLYFPTVY